LLDCVGKRLGDLACKRIFIARLGGDEFGILINGTLNNEEIVETGALLLETLRAPFNMEGITAQLGGTIGFATWQDIEDTGDRLFERADYALYHAKENSKGNTTVFNEQHAVAIKEASKIDRCIQSADLTAEMHLVYQPIVTPQEARTAGFEALARWQSPTLGAVSPDVFIHAAERTGVINRLTAVLLEKAIEEARNWPDDMFLSFNISMHDISCAITVLKLVSIVDKSGFDPRRISFEITETAVMTNHAIARENLNLLKTMGSKIVLDDFGTGQSSLAYVRSLPLDKLKLDRSFVCCLEEDEDAGSIVDLMLEMCRCLKIECIVEGVETLGQLSILESMGCESIQGYYFSEPLSGLDALGFLNAERNIEPASSILAA
jgi:predicted signal transduction protein with EAL and GGDEF domain